MPSPSTWAIRLSGEPFDLEDLPDLFRDNPMLTVEKVTRYNREVYRLRSPRLDGIADGWEALRVGEELVALLNGAMTVQRSNHRTIRAENPTPILADGSEGAIVLPPSVEIRMKGGRLRVLINGVPTDGIPEPAGRSLAQASADPAVAELLRFVGEGTWFSLYKALETMALCTRGGVQRLRIFTHTSKVELDRFEQTAHWFHRHAGAVRGDPPPQNPMTLSDAKRLVRELAGRWIDHIASSNGRHDRNARHR